MKLEVQKENGWALNGMIQPEGSTPESMGAYSISNVNSPTQLQFRWLNTPGVSNVRTAASFVRSSRKFDAPRTFVEALKAKYASDPVVEPFVEDPNVKIVYVGEPVLPHQHKPIRISGKEVEEVGFDKIRNKLADLHELRIVILDGLCMSRPEARLEGKDKENLNAAWPEGLTDVTEACPKTIELDLSRNLFEEWREIASICEQLRRLNSLRAE